MKLFYMIILLIYQIGLIIFDKKLIKDEIEMGIDIHKELRRRINLIIGLIPIAICIIGALG